MRRWFWITLISAVILAVAGAASAAPVGGLSYNLGVRGFAFSVGSGVGFTQRDVHVLDNDRVVDESSSSRFLIKADIAPTYFLDLYGLIGAGDFQLSDADYRGSLNGVYGFGVRPMILPYTLKTDLNVTADLQYLTQRTEDHSVEAKYDEFQAALIIAYKLKGIVPYGGFKYDQVKIQFPGARNDLGGDQNAGLFIGADYFITPTVFFNGELSIFSETSFSLMVGYNFPSIH